jgi:hypothetical protein
VKWAHFGREKGTGSKQIKEQKSSIQFSSDFRPPLISRIEKSKK